MIEAVKAGDSEKLQQLLAADPSLADARNPQGQSAVLLAAYRQRTDIVRLLLDAGATTDVFEAAAAGQLQRVRALVDGNAALVNSHASDGFTPLGLASFFGHKEIVEFLVDQGAQVHLASKNELAVMPLHSAAAARHTGIVDLLLRHGADPNARQRSSFTPLHSAAHNGQTEMVLLLLAAGADIAARSDEGLTPLQLALDRGHHGVAELLRRRGATDAAGG
jgi:ankyrin repeat protein